MCFHKVKNHLLTGPLELCPNNMLGRLRSFFKSVSSWVVTPVCGRRSKESKKEKAHIDYTPALQISLVDLFITTTRPFGLHILYLFSPNTRPSGLHFSFHLISLMHICVLPYLLFPFGSFFWPKTSLMCNRLTQKHLEEKGQS